MYKILISAFLCSGCTYSVIMNHTEGQASDVVDENATPSAEINPNVSVIPS